MTSEPQPQLRLSPEHFEALALFRERRVVGAVLCRGGQFNQAGFVLYGRFEFLANCGLLELLTRDGRRDKEPGDVIVYYYLKELGRELLRWRLDPAEPTLNSKGSAPSYGEEGAARLPHRP